MLTSWRFIWVLPLCLAVLFNVCNAKTRSSLPFLDDREDEGVVILWGHENVPGFPHPARTLADIEPLYQDNFQPDLDYYTRENMIITIRDLRKVIEEATSLHRHTYVVLIHNNTVWSTRMPRQAEYATLRIRKFSAMLSDAARHLSLTLPNTLFLLNAEDESICHRLTHGCGAPAFTFFKRRVVGEVLAARQSAAAAALDEEVAKLNSLAPSPNPSIKDIPNMVSSRLEAALSKLNSNRLLPVANSSSGAPKQRSLASEEKKEKKSTLRRKGGKPSSKIAAGSGNQDPPVSDPAAQNDDGGTRLIRVGSNDVDLLLPHFGRPYDSLYFFPWKRKTPKALLRAFIQGSMGPMSTRYRLAQLSVEDQGSPLLDVGIVGNRARFRADPRVMRPYLNQSSHARWRFLLNSDGHTASCRLGAVMQANSVVLRQRSRWIEYYYRSLQPYKHYVPYDINNILEVMEELKNPLNDRDLRALALASQRFKHRYLNSNAKALFSVRALSAYTNVVVGLSKAADAVAAELHDALSKDAADQRHSNGKSNDTREGTPEKVSVVGDGFLNSSSTREEKKKGVRSVSSSSGGVGKSAGKRSVGEKDEEGKGTEEGEKKSEEDKQRKGRAGKDAGNEDEDKERETQEEEKSGEMKGMEKNKNRKGSPRALLRGREEETTKKKKRKATVGSGRTASETTRKGAASFKSVADGKSERREETRGKKTAPATGGSRVDRKSDDETEARKIAKRRGAAPRPAGKKKSAKHEGPKDHVIPYGNAWILKVLDDIIAKMEAKTVQV